MIYLTLLKRSPIRRKRSSARKNRIHDRAYLIWLASQRCLISGKPATIHHVRRFGENQDGVELAAVDLIEETLSDNSKVYNVRLRFSNV